MAMISDGKLGISVKVDTSQALAGMGRLKKLIEAAEVKLGKEAAAEAVRELDYATSTWKSNPVFKATSWQRSSHLVVNVKTASQIFIYVDQGTRAHIIRPKGDYPLRFMSGYKAKSKVGILRSYSGGAFGDAVRAMVVHHPGTKARGFMDKVQIKVGKWALKRARELMSEAAAKH